jgi:hypothetical protein
LSERGLTLRGQTLAFAAVVEVGTGLVLMLAPALVTRLLLGGELTGTGVLLGRCFGIALFAQGLACWPQRQRRAESSLPAFRSMLAYNTLIALCLAYVGLFEQQQGILLWPAVALHLAVALLLAWTSRDTRSNAQSTVAR